MNILKAIWHGSRQFVITLFSAPRSLIDSGEDAQSGAALSPLSLLRKREALTQQLPAGLVAAFDSAPLAPMDVRFVGRVDELQQLLALVEDWRNGRASLTAIFGPRGAGITSCLNQLIGHLQSHESVNYFSLAQSPCSVADALRLMAIIFEFEAIPSTVNEMILSIRNSPARVIVIDDGHRLLARKMGNLAALETIAAILVATQTQHCWIIGCSKQAWRRLCFVHQSDHFFNRIIELEYFNAGEMYDVIERRFYGLGFEWQLRSDLEPGKSDPMPALFKQLHVISDGLLEMAFFILLFAVDKKIEANKIILNPFSHLDAGAIKNCSEEEFFSLAEIFVHGVMQISDHDILFRLKPEQSLIRLERLCRAGLLARNATTEHYTSNNYYTSTIFSQALVERLVLSNRLY